MYKEHGKLTAEQFKEFIAKLPEVSHQRNEFGRLRSDLPKEKFDKLMVGGFSWAEIYESSFTEHVAIATMAFNQVKWPSNLAASPDPQQMLLETWPSEIEEDTRPAFEPQDLIGLAYSLQRTILSIMLFQRSISALIQEVRDHDDLNAFFNAVRLDRTTVSCPTIADKIARAQMRQDTVK